MDIQLKIEGVTIKSPSEFKIEKYNLTKSGRLASGRMVMDLVAKKRKFLLKYEAIRAVHLKPILDIIDGTNMFMNFEYVENNEWKSALVYVGDIPADLHRTGNDWVWKNFEFHLIEQ